MTLLDIGLVSYQSITYGPPLTVFEESLTPPKNMLLTLRTHVVKVYSYLKPLHVESFSHISAHASGVLTFEFVNISVPITSKLACLNHYVPVFEKIASWVFIQKFEFYSV